MLEEKDREIRRLRAMLGDKDQLITRLRQENDEYRHKYYDLKKKLFEHQQSRLRPIEH